ncbi:MAG: DUF4342 domain-containing protein [Clostridiales bacterium]|nr:DUF4342 domain-containing protein [Clostridiales bacterium]
MDKFEMVEKLKTKTNVSYEEAKKALEETEWDILDAVVYLERKGIIDEPSVGYYKTNNNREEENNDDIKDKNNNSKEESLFERFIEFICKYIDKGNSNMFKIINGEKVILKIPLTVIIVLLIFAFWIVIPLLIIALFFEIKFSLEGPNTNNDKINSFLKQLSINANKIKEEFKKGNKND